MQIVIGNYVGSLGGGSGGGPLPPSSTSYLYVTIFWASTGLPFDRIIDNDVKYDFLLMGL